MCKECTLSCVFFYRRLSMEVDRILMDLPSPSSHVPSSAPPNHTHKFKLTPNHHDDAALDSNLRGIHKEEQQLQVGPSLSEKA